MDEEPRSYIEDGFRGMEPVHLTDDEYVHAIESFVIACADAVIIDRKANVVYLAKRKHKPAQNMWWMIGGRRKPGISARDAMRHIFKRETSLDMPEERFTFVSIAEYMWKDRHQRPQEKGNHLQGYTFSIELTEEERNTAGQNLDSEEYHAEMGLAAFSLDDLKNGTHHPSIIEIAKQALAK